MLNAKGVTDLAAPALPDADPIPWLTDMWRQNGCFAADFATAIAALKGEAEAATDQVQKDLSAYAKTYPDYVKSQTQHAAKKALAEAAFGDVARSLSSVIAEVSGTVASLHSDPNPYRVVFSNISSAGTNHASRTVQIGTRLLLDSRPEMTEGRRAAGLVGIAVHETGHIEDSQPYGEAVIKHFGEKNMKAYSLHNVGEDNRIERRQMDRYPALRAALECAAYYMSELAMDQITASGKTPPFKPDLATAEGRDKALKMGTRYPWTVDWTGQDESLAFIRGWAERMAADHTPKEHVSLIEEALEWVNDLPEEEEPTEGGDEDGDSDESEDEPQPTEGGNKSQPKDEKPEPTEGEPNEQPEGESGEAEGDDEDGDGGEADDEGEDEGEGADSEPADDGEAGEGEGEESDEESDSEANDPTGGSSTDAEGDDDMDTDPEGDGESLDQPEGNPEGEPKSSGEANDSPAEGETPQSGDSGSDEATEGDLDEVPEIPDCQNDAAHDSENDSLADDLTQAHANARKDVSRMRRYPGATGGTVIVRETRFGGKAKVMAEQAEDRMSLGEAVDESDAKARQIAVNAVDGDGSYDYAEGFATKDNPNAHAALAAVLTSQRKGSSAPERGAVSGRLDRGRLSRVATGNPRVFIKQVAPAPQKVRVHILIDGSGSMGTGERSNRAKAAQVGRDLAGALDKLPWATGRIYGFADAGQDNFVTRIWETGQNRDAIDNFLYAPSGGTPLGYCMAYVSDDLLDEQKPGEKGVVIVISDGEPSYGGGTQHVKNVTEYYRKRGLRVVSVAIVPLDASQKAMFGTDYVTYEPNVTLFAKKMAKVIGSSL